MNEKSVKQPSCWHGEGLVVWIEDQSRQDIPPSESLIHGKALILFSSVKAERGEQAEEEKFEVAGFNPEV